MIKTEDIHSFFYDRLLEAFHKETIDSHRVRCHNSLTLLLELEEVVTDWIKGNIKVFDTVKFCLEETNAAIKNDTCLSFESCRCSILSDLLIDFKKNGEKDFSYARKVQYILNSVIEENVPTYKQNLYNAISSIVLTEFWDDDKDEMTVLEDLDRLITSFATQLIHEGFSKIYLYKIVARVCNDTKHSFAAQVRYLNRLLCSGSIAPTTTIIKIPVNNLQKWISPILDLYDRIPDEYLSPAIVEAHQTFVTPSKATKYYIHNSIVAKDSVSALKETRESLSRVMDVIHMGDSSVNINIPNSALVISKNTDGSIHFEMAKEYVLDGGYRTNEMDVISLIDHINRIRDDESIADDVKERLNAALRHLRIGNMQNELEQRFINYWIALEFIFASPEAKESTFTRLKANLMSLLSSCYIKRNIIDMEKKLKKNGIIDKEDSLWLLDEGSLQDIINSESNCLMRYRLRKIKSLIIKRDKRKNYFSVHETNIEHQLARLYRLRNELIHEAAIKQDIESVTSNLRYYLVFLLNQIVHFLLNVPHCSKKRQIGLSDFFYQYDLFKRRIEESYDLNVIMSVPCEISSVN